MPNSIAKRPLQAVEVSLPGSLCTLRTIGSSNHISTIPAPVDFTHCPFGVLVCEPAWLQDLESRYSRSLMKPAGRFCKSVNSGHIVNEHAIRPSWPFGSWMPANIARTNFATGKSPNGYTYSPVEPPRALALHHASKRVTRFSSSTDGAYSRNPAQAVLVEYRYQSCCLAVCEAPLRIYRCQRRPDRRSGP